MLHEFKGATLLRGEFDDLVDAGEEKWLLDYDIEGVQYDRVHECIQLLCKETSAKDIIQRYHDWKGYRAQVRVEDVTMLHEPSAKATGVCTGVHRITPEQFRNLDREQIQEDGNVSHVRYDRVRRCVILYLTKGASPATFCEDFQDIWNKTLCVLMVMTRVPGAN